MELLRVFFVRRANLFDSAYIGCAIGSGSILYGVLIIVVGAVISAYFENKLGIS